MLGACSRDRVWRQLDHFRNIADILPYESCRNASVT